MPFSLYHTEGASLSTNDVVNLDLGHLAEVVAARCPHVVLRVVTLGRPRVGGASTPPKVLEEVAGP